MSTDKQTPQHNVPPTAEEPRAEGAASPDSPSAELAGLHLALAVAEDHATRLVQVTAQAAEEAEAHPLTSGAGIGAHLRGIADAAERMTTRVAELHKASEALSTATPEQLAGLAPLGPPGAGGFTLRRSLADAVDAAGEVLVMLARANRSAFDRAATTPYVGGELVDDMTRLESQAVELGLMVRTRLAEAMGLILLLPAEGVERQPLTAPSHAVARSAQLAFTVSVHAAEAATVAEGNKRLGALVADMARDAACNVAAEGERLRELAALLNVPDGEPIPESLAHLLKTPWQSRARGRFNCAHCDFTTADPGAAGAHRFALGHPYRFGVAPRSGPLNPQHFPIPPQGPRDTALELAAELEQLQELTGRVAARAALAAELAAELPGMADDELPGLVQAVGHRASREKLNVAFLAEFLEAFKASKNVKDAWSRVLSPVRRRSGVLPDVLVAFASLPPDDVHGVQRTVLHAKPPGFEALSSSLASVGWTLEGWEPSSGKWVARRAMLTGAVFLEAPTGQELVELVMAYNRRAAAADALFRRTGPESTISLVADAEVKRAVEAQGWHLEGWAGSGWVAVRQVGPNDVRVLKSSDAVELLRQMVMHDSAGEVLS